MLLDLLDLVAKSKVELKVVFNFVYTVHDCSVIFNTDLRGDFGGTHREFSGEEEHGDLAGGFDIGDARFTSELLGGEVIIFSNFFYDLFAGSGAEFAGLSNTGGAIFDKL